MDKSFFCRYADLDDADFVASRVRSEDKEELLVSHASVQDALRHAVAVSEYAYAWGFGENLCAVGGIAPGETPLEKQIWMIGTHEIERHPVDLMCYTRFLTSYFLERYVKLYNFVSCRNTTSCRYLARSGAKFFMNKNIYRNQHLFYYFEFAK